VNERALVEAALFSAGRALSLEELARATGFDPARVKGHLRDLAKAYEGRNSAIEIVPIGTKWTMQIRSEYSERARSFAPPEIGRDLLKTAALIAYHQPILQSDLFDMVGSKVYEHTQALEGLGLISRKPKGRSLELATTRYFAEFFGLKTTDREGIRRIMAEKAGIAYTERGTAEVAEPGAAPEDVERPAADSGPPAAEVPGPT